MIYEGGKINLFRSQNLPGPSQPTDTVIALSYASAQNPAV
jgi:hypothetical protein